MRRREFITLLGGAAAALPLAARAQQSDPVRRIGVLMFYSEKDSESQDLLAAFREGLEEVGWTVGQNLAIDHRWNIADVGRARTAAAEMLTLAPDVILAISTPAVQGLLAVTRTVPAVFTFVTEPVAQGFIESLERPGGNLTGFAHLPAAVGEKWVELLKEVAPRTTRVGFITNPQAGTQGDLFFESIQLAAAKFSAPATLLQVHEPGEVNRALATFSRDGSGGLIVGPDNFTLMHRRLIVDLAKRYRLPTVASGRDYVEAGGLLSYGINGDEHVKQAASYVDRILRGEKPADLPVQEPDEFELVINMKTARALGLTVPATLKTEADEVIE
jgi:putative tryptophan/tyrosine transport system substrate-binding protein